MRLGRGGPASLAAAVCVTAALAHPSGAAADSTPPQPAARAWVLVDAQDGARIAGAGESEPLPMASTAKLMTAYVALRDLPLAKTLVAPPYHPLPGESLMGLRAGERVSVREALYGLLLPSGNDAAAALAVGDAGSIPAFARRMNAAATRLGLDATHYENPIGLDAPGEYASAEDLATLSLRLRRDPLFRRIVDTPRKTLSAAHPHTVVNRNDLVARVPWINGIKTGYTPNAGNVLVASGTRKGVTLVSVVMGAPTEGARDADTLSLLRYGFSLYRRVTPVRGGERLGAARVRHADGRVPLVAARGIAATVRRGQAVDVRLDAPRSVAAPVGRGDRIGRAVVAVDDRFVGSTPVLAARAVSQAGGKSPLSRVDDAIPGPRAVLWILVAAAATIVIGIAIVATRHGEQGESN